MIWTHRCMIVPAAFAPLARALSEGIAGESGAGMWTTPLSPTGTAPATHFVSTGLIRQDMADLLASADATYAAAQAAGASVTRQQVDALLAAADITEEEPFAAIARLNLRMVQSPSI